MITRISVCILLIFKANQKLKGRVKGFLLIHVHASYYILIVNMNSIKLPRALTLLVYLLTIVVYQFITNELLAFHHRLI